MLLIGSRAAKYWFPTFREPKDWDIICSLEELTKWQKENQNLIETLIPNDQLTKFKARLKDKSTVEFELIEKRESSKLLWERNRLVSEFYRELNVDLYIAPINALLAIKKSHLNYPIHWLKNIEDYHYLKDCNISMDNEIYKKRLEETNQIHGKHKKTSFEDYLSKPNTEFFKQSSGLVKRYYSHDDIHKVTCYFEKPIYDSLKLNKDLALIDKDLFDKLTLDLKIKMVQEEGFAIALERQIIPKIEAKESYDSQEAFKYAIQKIGTVLTKDWLQEFVIENYPKIIELKYDYVSKFLNNIPERII